MMQHPNPETLAHAFWAGTGLQDAFPRDIERAIAIKLPLALVKLPQLNTQVIGQWLERRRILTPLALDPRDLCGSLVAYRGYGIIFVCGADDQAEQRLTAAHEVAHFLVDYLLPRQQVIQALGEHMTEVLDGLRKATPAERASAILSHLRLGAHTHLLPRHGQTRTTRASLPPKTGPSGSRVNSSRHRSACTLSCEISLAVPQSTQSMSARL
jgi:hypothetical protein